MLKTNEPMCQHTTFRIGGPADFYAEPESKEELIRLVMSCRKEHREFSVIGNGSNLLVGDRGYRGMVIALGKSFSGICVSGNEIEAEAGALLSAIAAAAMKESLAGMEFASGIPGSLGGAVVMNAGAYGGEIKDILSGVTVLEEDGTEKKVLPEELALGYRSSNVLSRNRIVLSAKFSLKPGKQEEISSLMHELNERRREKQPLEYPSAGSAFKRPAGFFAGRLIQDAGLSGFSVGGAKVSEKHCGFIINTGKATAEDVRNLIREIQERVFLSSGVRLEPEIKMMGEFE